MRQVDEDQDGIDNWDKLRQQELKPTLEKTEKESD